MDWEKAIAELRRLGVKQPEIAEACGCSQATISMLANGKIKDPRDSIGQALRRLLESHGCQPAHETAPPTPPATGAGAGAVAVGG